MPQTPNFKPGIGRLVTDRYDFQSHIDGTSFQHTADQIIVSPSVTINSSQITNVQSAIEILSLNLLPPVVPDATLSSKGIIALGGDLNSSLSTALNPRLNSLQGQLLNLSFNPLTTNQVIQWNGSFWINGSIPQATTSSLGTIKLSASPTPTAGDIGNTANIPRVIGINGIPISSTPPSGNNVLMFDGVASDLSYNFISDANVATGAAIQGSKILPNFGSQNISTTGTAALGSTTITGNLITTGTTNANAISGSLAVSMRNAFSSFTVDNIFTDYIIFVYTSTPISITLPTPTFGRVLIIKDVVGSANTNNITILQHSTERIEGVASSFTMSTNWGSISLASDGFDWWMV